MSRQGWCLVLGGGGAKGVYHLGVWKALRRLRIRPSAIVGNSIGAIMAACMAQNAWEELNHIVDTMDIGTFLKLPPSLVERGRLSFRQADSASILSLTRSLARKKGFDTSPLRQLLQRTIDEERIRASGIDLGLVTFNLSDFKPCELFLEDIPKGCLVDFLMASSALPGFKPLKIRNKSYLDGGVFDNIPYDMARKRGYRNIIVVDISGIGMVKRFDFAGARVVYIKNSINMGDILDFSPQFIRDFRRLGYLDTLQAFGKVGGSKYFIKPSRSVEPRFLAWLSSRELAPARLKSVLPPELRQDSRLLLHLMEAAALCLDVPRVELYSYRDFAAILSHKKRDCDVKIEAFLSENAAKAGTLFEELVAQPVREGRFEHPVYYYHVLVQQLASGPIQHMLSHLVDSFHPGLKAGLKYFELAADFWKKNWLRLP